MIETRHSLHEFNDCAIHFAREIGDCTQLAVWLSPDIAIDWCAMRRAASFLIPVTLITIYYAFWVGLMAFLLDRFPIINEFFPVGGLNELAARDEVSSTGAFEPIYSSVEDTVWAPFGPIKLACASLGAAIVIIPVSWVYFITSRFKEVDQSFVQTIIIMPIVVTGISMIVMNSIVYLRGDQYRTGGRYRRARDCGGHIGRVRLFNSDHLETGVREDSVWPVLLHADAPGPLRGRILICVSCSP